MMLIRVDEEKRALQEKAKKCGQSIAGMLRALRLGYPLISRLDQFSLDTLMKESANLGRLGGLVKWWLTQNIDIMPSFGNRTYESIEALVDEIEQNQREMFGISRKLF